MSVMTVATNTVSYLRHVKFEVRKITYPTMIELRQQTIAIVIVVTIMGVRIGLMDWAFSMLFIRGLGGLVG